MESCQNPSLTQCKLSSTSLVLHRSLCGLLAVSLSGKISFCGFNQLIELIRNQIIIVQDFQHYYMMASSDSWKAVEYLSKGAQWLAWLWWWAGCLHCKALCTLGWHRQKLRALTLLDFLSCWMWHRLIQVHKICGQSTLQILIPAWQVCKLRAEYIGLMSNNMHKKWLCYREIC